MKKKIIALLLILLLMITFITPVQSINTTKQNTTEVSTQLSTASDSYLLKSTTIGTITALIKDHLRQMSSSSRFKQRFTKYLELGLYEMEKLGVTSEKNLLETQSILTDGMLPIDGLKRHLFLMNINPDTVAIKTTIPRRIENLTGDNSTLEIFIKLYPFTDSVETTQRITLRKLYQTTSLLWPAIGARVIENNITTFIIAFGPGIKREWKLF